jgi:SAM-dependent methyltransferase
MKTNTGQIVPCYSRAMSTFSKKLNAGQIPTDSEWEEHLIEAHKIAPSMTPYAFAPHKTKEGKNSYELLADKLSNKDSTILDLACGDGHLIQYLLPKLGPEGRIYGADMSSGELDVAKKTYKDSRVQFHEARAQNLPLKSESVDLVLCHMAFMLMTPIEPVVRELARVLKPGGKFVAVIGGSKDGSFSEFRKVFFGYVSSRFQKIKEVRTGDPRLLTQDGLIQVFENYFSVKNTSDFELLINIAPEEIWDWVKDLYFVGMLPEEDKTKLKTELIAVAKTKSTQGRLQFESSMRIFTAVKN